MKTNQRQLIGTILLSFLLFTYLQYSSLKPPTKTTNTPTTTQTTQPTSSLNTLAQTALSTPPISQKDLLLENQDIRLWIAPQTGAIKKVILKHYKDNNNQPLTLLKETKSNMAWLLENSTNTQHLHFNITQQNNQIILHANPQQSNQHITCTYTLPEKGYTLNCKLHTQGLNTSTDNLKLLWYYAPQNLEQDFNLNKRNTYAQYHLAKKGLKYATENKNLNLNNITWLAIKQRFFTIATIAPKNTTFTNATLNTITPEQNDKDTLIQTSMALSLPQNQTLTFYLGPNTQKALANIAPEFTKNHYLGFTPIRHLNKYIIAPLANFFDSHTPHYLWVLLLLALFFKLLQLYFLYKDYIITIKQQALQHTIKQIKAKYKDKQQAQLAEMDFYTSMGLPRVPFLIKFFTALFEIPIFMSMIYFIPQNIALRHLPFLWSTDLSSPDHFIELPLHIPLLGNHISLFALLMSLSFILRSTQNPPQEGTPNMQLFKYITPITLFLIFNKNAAAFCLYRIVANILSIIPNLLFKLCVNKDYHLAQLKKQQTNKAESPSQELPRALVRLEKKKNKK